MDFKLPHFGQFFLWIAASLSIVQLIFRFKNDTKKKTYLLNMGIFFCLALALSILIFGHITSNFDFLNVALHSHTQKPFLYKVSGTWGNHEGSMLLFVTFLSIYGAFFSKIYYKNQSDLLVPSSTFLNMLYCSNLFFLIFACNPFDITDPNPNQGLDLNPLLQDPSLAIHPPILYLGFTGFIIPFVITLSALISKKIDKNWAKNIYIWVLTAWIFLTAGLCLGSFWAYYELGWGGWWFWDPVENAAIMPWLVSTSALHSLRISIYKNKHYKWSAAFILLTFCLCLLGLFLVRSGMLTSVHSFAIDPARGIWLGLNVLVCALLSLWIFAVRAKFITTSTDETIIIDRSLLIAIQNSLMFLATITILLGTIYPLILEFFNINITVGAPYFNATIVPMFWPILLFLPHVFNVGWNTKKISIRDILVYSGLLLFSAAILWPLKNKYDINFVQYVTFTIVVYGIFVVFKSYGNITKELLINKNYPMILAHVGVYVTVFGMLGSTIFEKEHLEIMVPGQTISFPGYDLTLNKINTIKRSNHDAVVGDFTIGTDGGKSQGFVAPEKRFYWTQKIIHPETAIYRNGVHHIHVILGDQYQNQSWSVKIYERPYIVLMWVGAIIVIFGGIASLFKAWLLRRKKRLIT